MGACLSISPEQAEATRHTRKLEKMMQEQARIEQETVKLLILGAGESGKSTLFKQMKVLYGTPPTTSEKKGMINVIHCNVIQSMQIMLGQVKNFLDESNKSNNMSLSEDQADGKIMIVDFKMKKSI